MPNIAIIFRQEIMRLARKEIRAQTTATRKMLTQLRATNAELKQITLSIVRKLNV